jgi:glycosidase
LKEKAMVEQRLSEIDLRELTKRRYFSSPSAWEDQVLYFLLVDRFSDGRETGYADLEGNVVGGEGTPPLRPEDAGSAVRTEEDARRWREAGRSWAGGTLRGLQTKLGYLRRLGVTAVWISPVLKQVAFHDTYHGYGIQNFLDIDRHFGTREDLRALVHAAHEQGIYVILDVILNHTGDVFAYDPDRYWAQGEGGGWFLDPRWDGSAYRVAGFHDRRGKPTLPFGRMDLGANPEAWPDGAVWPAELQDPTAFTQRGRIDNWDHDPEFLEGDFFDLKDIHQGGGPLDDYRPSAALGALCDAYKFWIAYADLDGFRVDTVKHMHPGATRFFASVIHEFTQAIGKENFYLIGEITGGRRRAFETLELTGLNAALGLGDVPDKLEFLPKGYRNPREYFDLFRNSELVQKESHVWFRDKIVTMVDDHDQVRKGRDKARFCAGEDGSKLVLNALALNATSMGIPCIYYGSEQAFDGRGGDDRYLREAMFGGEFGPFGSRHRHSFIEEHPVYRELAKILSVRKEKLALRRGRQYLRPISGDGHHFGLPEMIGGRLRSVVPWSRIFDDREVLLAINTDPVQPRTAWATIDDGLHRTGDRLACLYSTDPGEIGREVAVEARNGKAVMLTVPAAGFVVYEKG